MQIDIAYRKQILFAAVFGGVIYAGYNEASDSVTNYKRGLFAAAFVLVAQGTLDQYTGPFTRSFKRFWRGVSRYTMIYMAILIFFLFQTPDDARNLLKHLDPSLGIKVTRDMHTYEENCWFKDYKTGSGEPSYAVQWLQWFWDAIIDNLDHYYAMHWVGWFVSALMIRDTYVLHFWSVLDEILELSWQHILPHFGECWYDHVLVDLAFSNTPAIYLGMFVIRKLGLREYDWLGRKGKKSIKDWDILKNHRRFGCALMLVGIMISNFLTGFFIINALWIPPVNFINIYRLSVWFHLGAMSIGELYDDASSWGTPQRLTTPISNEYRWIASGVTVLEAVISFKFRHDTGNITNAPTPLYIAAPWIITVGSALVYYAYLRLKKNRTTKGGDSEWEIAERRKDSTRLAEKERKQKAKAAAEAAAGQTDSNAAAPEVKNDAKNKKPAQADQKKQAETKAEPAAPVKAGDNKNKKVAQGDDNEWKVAGGSKTGKQQKQKQAQKQEVEEEEEEREDEEPVRVEQIRTPVEDEWREIKAPRVVKKQNKKKRD